MLKTPISYYGGKQSLISEILPLIPPHKIYVEPFLGGGAVFFAKEPSEVEVINDTNLELINFYKICKNRFHELQSLVRITLYSRSIHDDAHIIYNKPNLFDEVRRAWAVWVLANQSFNSDLNGSWSINNLRSIGAKKLTKKKEVFIEDLAIRLQNTQIECIDALYIISNRDKEETFFYVDPPYFNANMGHYDGYTIEDFERLLQKLSQIKGKFLLSSYPSKTLEIYTNNFNWYTKKIPKALTSPRGKNKRKIEVLTANYPI